MMLSEDEKKEVRRRKEARRRASWTPEEHQRQLERVREWRRNHRRMLKARNEDYYTLHADEIAEKRKQREALKEERRAMLGEGAHSHPEEPTFEGERRITPDGYEETATHCARCGRLAWMNEIRPTICPECFIRQNVLELHDYIDERERMTRDN